MKIHLTTNPVTEFYVRCVKHLQHLDLQFGPRENPYHPLLYDADKIRVQLIDRLLTLGIQVDPYLLTTQQYLNDLHQIYFDRCSSTVDIDTYLAWTHAHDLIHSMEIANGTRSNDTNLSLNYRNLAGLLYEKFDRSLLQYAVTDVTRGTCFLREQELGKNPIVYYLDREVTDIGSLCRICRPWINLIPTVNIATEDSGEHHVPAGFHEWFEPLRQAWCRHWNQPGWQAWETRAMIPIGIVEDIDVLIDCFQRQDYPVRVCYETG